jgi:hypothetical protein
MFLPVSQLLQGMFHLYSVAAFVFPLVKEAVELEILSWTLSHADGLCVLVTVIQHEMYEKDSHQTG